VGSVDDLYDWYSQLTRQVQNDVALLKPVATKLVAGESNDLEKIRKIFYWVQDNIRYVAFEDGIAGFKPEAAHKVYQNRFGDCKGMANLTKTLLTQAGFDARLCWIGTSLLPYGYETPSLAVNNHMICAVFINGKHYYLDPTEKFSAFGEYAERIQGKQALIENGDKYIIDRIPVTDKDHNLIHRKETFSLAGNELRGSANLRITGESKKDMLYLMDAIRKDKKELAINYFLAGGDKNLLAKNIVLSDLNDREKDMSFGYDLEVANHVNAFEQDIYVDLDLYKEFANLTLDSDRVSDYDFGKKINRRHTVTLQLPDNCTIKHLPANLVITHESFTFRISYRQEDKKIHCEKELVIPAGIIRKKDFTAWNTAIRQLGESYGDQIILTK